MVERNIYYDGKLIVTKYSGDVIADELISSTHWMIDNFDGLIHPGFSQLIDAREADTETVSENDIHRIAHINLHYGKKRGNFAIAIVATSPYPVALARLHKLLSAAAEIDVEIFEELKPAYQWLEYKNPEMD